MSASLSPQDSPYFIRSAWPSFSQSKAIAAIVEKYNWSKVVFVYEDSGFGRGLVPFLDEAMLESNAHVSFQTAISPTATDDQIGRELDKLMKMQTRVFVVDMLPDLASRFFKLAKEAGMMEKGYAWIVSDPLASLLDLMDSKTVEAMQGLIGVKARVQESEEVTNFTKRYNKRFREENPEMDLVKLNVFGLWAYHSMAIIADSIERAGVTSPRFNRSVDGGNSTDLEAIGTSNTGSLLVGLMKNYALKGLSGDFNISNGQLQPSAFEVVNILGVSGVTVGFWSERCGLLKPGDREDGCSSKTENLDLVVWPGKTCEAPKGWEFPTSGKKLRVGIPPKGGFHEFIDFAKNVFEEVWNKTPYAAQIEYIQSDDGEDYDGFIKQLDLKVAQDDREGTNYQEKDSTVIRSPKSVVSNGTNKITTEVNSSNKVDSEGQLDAKSTVKDESDDHDAHEPVKLERCRPRQKTMILQIKMYVLLQLKLYLLKLLNLWTKERTEVLRLSLKHLLHKVAATLMRTYLKQRLRKQRKKSLLMKRWYPLILLL
ncbi:glutamate receptor 2.1-like [Salvia splendens]|uniref:glutamate receptor 2.1-like n=1 Tax=Salvia splendens TaxID=180675 RepID=UPI001C269341|nr:glutamate receptor 2.1-like [Salvia splendens]XP_042022816.1 glutamate receptor 2.1-like [Salvia splendens]